MAFPAPRTNEPPPNPEDLFARYPPLERTVQAGGRSFSLLTAGDTNALLDRLDPTAFALDERLPYWAELWASSVALAEFCLCTPALRGSSVLELGCGLGLGGIAAAAAGARVVMTDYEPDALGFARVNTERNLPGAVERGEVTLRLMDWRAPVHDGPFDWILGADVAYEHRNLAPLIQTVDMLLAQSGTAVLMDPGRSTGAALAALAGNAGFNVSSESAPAPRHDATSRVVRFVLRRRNRP